MKLDLSKTVLDVYFATMPATTTTLQVIYRYSIFGVDFIPKILNTGINIELDILERIREELGEESKKITKVNFIECDILTPKVK